MFKTLLVALAALVLVPTASHAQDQRIGGYMALLGPEDLFNSSGVRLTSAAAIIQQDRANFHRFGIRHANDTPDPWFHSRGHRAAIPGLVVMSDFTAEIIARQGALVAVSVFADATGQMTRMIVEIPG